MTPEAFSRTLPAYAKRAPFRPFAIELVSGHSITVRHPEAVAIWDNIIVYRNERGEFHVLDFQGICRLYDLTLPATQGTSA